MRCVPTGITLMLETWNTFVSPFTIDSVHTSSSTLIWIGWSSVVAEGRLWCRSILGWLCDPICLVYSSLKVESLVSKETGTQSLLGILCGCSVNRVTWLIKEARWSSVVQWILATEEAQLLKILDTWRDSTMVGELGNSWRFVDTWHGSFDARQYLGFYDLWADLGI